jgi:hypothetical protein
MHVHVHAASGDAKFWLEPRVELAQNYGLPPGMLRVAYKLVRVNESTIRQAWESHFGR